jgi:hypothetical protein
MAFVFLLGPFLTSIQDDADSRSARIHFSIDQVGGLSRRELSAAIDQIRMIWKPAGVTTTFGRYGDAVPAAATRVSLRLIHERRYDDERPILAWASLAPDGRPEPALFVSVPGVLELLSNTEIKGRPFTQRPLALRQQLIGQVIGRVVAHELGHYLLQSAGHTHNGLMRPRYSADDLVGPWLHPFQVPAADWPIVRREVTRIGQLQATR